MRRTATWVAGAAVLAALTVGLATAAAAPAAKSSAAKISPAKAAQLTKLSRLDGQYLSLAKRAKKCPGAAAVLRATGKQRAAALKKARRSSVRALRARNTRMSKAVLRLAKFEGRCPPQFRTVNTVSPGAAQSAPGAPPGSVALSLTTPGALNSPMIDVSPALDGGALPDDISLVSLDELTEPICSTVGAACVGVDPDALITTLEELVAGAPALAPIVNPLLDQVTALLEAGDLDPLFEVRRISDTVIQLVPEGPLATLAALLEDAIAQASDTVGRIQVV